ncbi:MAG: dihydroorotase, partial [Candidatus Fonsibacter sp.]|nr:dihydroorotase [Candidatus Fonsibacter sp.]
MKLLINTRVIDPQNNIDEVGGILIDENGKIKAVGKKVTKDNAPKDCEIIDCKGNISIPGIVDMRVFVGEPGFEYKENFRTLSEAALSGGVTSVVTMPNTMPVIDNGSILDFTKRRAKDKSLIKIYPLATLTKNLEGNEMSEFGLLGIIGAIGFTDGIKCV